MPTETTDTIATALAIAVDVALTDATEDDV